MGNLAFFRTVISVFLRDFEFLVVAVREDLERHDAHEAIRRLHKLDGSADQIGATRLSIAAHEAESLVIDADKTPELESALYEIDLQLKALVASARRAFPEIPA